MTIIVLLVSIVGFWLERAAGLKISPYEGLSISNLSLYAMFVLIVFNAKIIRWRPGILEVTLFALILWYLCSIPIKLMNPEFPAVDVFAELRSFKSWVTPFLFFFLFSLLINDEKTARRLTFALVLVAVWSAVASLMTANGLTILARAGTNVEGRAYAFAEPNQFAAYLVFMAPLLIALMQFGRTLVRKATGALGFVCVVGALVATGSRGGLVAFVVAILTYIAIGIYFRTLKPITGIAVTSALIVMLGLGVVLAPRDVRELTLRKLDFKGSGDLSEYTSGRSMLLEKGMEMFRKRPAFGHGQDSFLPLMMKNYRVKGVSHNEYLGYAVEQGTVGLVLLLTVYGSLIFSVYRALRSTESPESRALFIGFFAGFLGLCVALFGVNLYGPRTLIWMFIASVMAYARLCREEHTGKTQICSDPEYDAWLQGIPRVIPGEPSRAGIGGAP